MGTQCFLILNIRTKNIINKGEAINLDDVYIKKTTYWRKYPHKFLKEYMGLKLSFIRVKWLKMRNKYAKLS